MYRRLKSSLHWIGNSAILIPCQILLLDIDQIDHRMRQILYEAYSTQSSCKRGRSDVYIRETRALSYFEGTEMVWY